MHGQSERCISDRPCFNTVIYNKSFKSYHCSRLSKEKLQEYLGNSYKGIPLQYIKNPVYDKTNNIYSLSLAKNELQEDDTLLIESDLILDDTLFRCW